MLIDKALLDALINSTEIFAFDQECPLCHRKESVRWATNNERDTAETWFYRYFCVRDLCRFRVETWNSRAYPFRCVKVVLMC